MKTIFHGVGTYLPKRVIANSEFEATLDTNDEWIQSRTGIMRRHIAAPEETTSSLGIKAGQAVMEITGFTPQDIDLIIVATSSPDNIFPATAARIQHGLGIQGAAFDIQAVCSGFIYAIVTADALLKQGHYKRALVIGAELYSRMLDWSDRNTCILFGDGAGAVIMEAVSVDSHGNRGFIHGKLWTDGSHYDALYVQGGVGSTPEIGKIFMNGREIFKQAVTHMSSAVEIVAKQVGISLHEIDWLVPHQANQRIMMAVAEKLSIEKERVFATVHEHANIAAATIPLALKHGQDTGKLKQGDLVALTALGAGLAWGSILLRW